MRKTLILALCLAIIPAYAYAIDANVLDQVTDGFRTKAATWSGAIQRGATRTFWELATLEFAWAMCRLAIRRPSADEIMSELINEVLFIGLFFWLMTEMSTVGPMIISSFRQAAQDAAAVGTITPSDIFASGMNLAKTVTDKVTIWDPGASAGIMIGGLAIATCYALIVACMILALVEGYFLVSAGVLLMAFGATRWTNDIAVSLLRAIMAVGVKLFTIQLIASIGAQFIQDWASQVHTMDSTQLFLIYSSALVLLVITKLVPEMFQRVIGGASLAHGGALVAAGAGAVATAAGVGMGVAALGTSIAGAGATMMEAGGLASEQMAASVAAGTAPATKLGRMASMAGQTISNVAKAGATDVGRRLSGTGSSHGSATWRAARIISNQRKS